MKTIIASICSNLFDFLIIFFGFLVALIMLKLLVAPVQIFFVPSYALPSASWLFLPHGIRVLSGWFYREKSVLPLALADFFAFYFFVGTDFSTSVLAGLIGGLSVLIVIKLFELAKVDMQIHAPNNFTWRAILLVGFLSSVFNAFGKIYLRRHQLTGTELVTEQLTFVMGSTMGTVAVFLILMWGFRLIRKYGH